MLLNVQTVKGSLSNGMGNGAGCAPKEEPARIARLFDSILGKPQLAFSLKLTKLGELTTIIESKCPTTQTQLLARLLPALSDPHPEIRHKTLEILSAHHNNAKPILKAMTLALEKEAKQLPIQTLTILCKNLPVDIVQNGVALHERFLKIMDTPGFYNLSQSAITSAFSSFPLAWVNDALLNSRLLDNVRAAAAANIAERGESSPALRSLALEYLKGAANDPSAKIQNACNHGIARLEANP